MNGPEDPTRLAPGAADAPGGDALGGAAPIDASGHLPTLHAPSGSWTDPTHAAAQASPAPPAPAPGSVTSRRYLHQTELAKGGMGQVLLVRDALLQRQVAQKVLRPERDTDPQITARFLAEARITGQLEHPNIVPVYDIERRDDGSWAFTMMNIVGESLKQVLHELSQGADRPERSQPRRLAMFLKVCDAMSYAHARGVVHRDLKPANVLIGAYGEVYVCDWGIAKLRPEFADPHVRPVEPSDQAFESTQRGMLVGTPSYMSPEQASGEVEHIDPRSDVFALGAILYELLTLHRPFGGGNPLALLLEAIRERPYEALPARDFAGQRISAALAAIVAKALAKSADDRYQNAGELAQDLLRLLDDLPVLARRETLLTALARRMRRQIQASVGIAATMMLVAFVAIGGLSVHLGRTKAAHERLVALRRAAVVAHARGQEALDRARAEPAKRRQHETQAAEHWERALAAARELLQGDRTDSAAREIAQQILEHRLVAARGAAPAERQHDPTDLAIELEGLGR